MSRILPFLKSQAAHKLFGLVLGVASTYLLSGHVDVSALLNSVTSVFQTAQ